MIPNHYPIPNARAAARVRQNLLTLAARQGGFSARRYYEDAAALLSPQRWRAAAARPELAGRLCSLAAGLTSAPPPEPPPADPVAPRHDPRDPERDTTTNAAW